MKTALVTGANRGLGLEFVRQLSNQGYHVIACCRNIKAFNQIKNDNVELATLDVTSDEDIVALKKKLGDRPISLIINNAGIAGDQGVTKGNIERENFLNVFNVNCLSVVKISDALLDNVKKSQEKCIVVITSQMGSISDNQRGRSYAYRASKSALNCVMRSFAIDIEPDGVNVMLLHPGWVKTNGSMKI